MTLPGVIGAMAAFAFVLGLLVLTLRLLRGLPALAARSGEGPELRVLSRASLSPKQGVATIRVGDRTLVVGYGDGGVRALSDLPTADAAMESPEIAPAADSAMEPPARPHLPAAPVPFREAIGRALRQVNLLGVVALLAGSFALCAPAPVAAAPASAAFPVSAAAQTPLTQQTTSVQDDAPSLADVDFPSIGLRVGDGEGDDDLVLEGPVGTVLFVGFLTLLPTLLLLMTSFTRILVVLHLLKQALGTQTAPPAHLISAMALLLTGFVMAPTLETANTTAVRPWLDGEIDEWAMMTTASEPFRDFMLGSVRNEDLSAFMAMSNTPAVETTDEIPLVVLSAAFVTSELRAAFQMGFALFLPFVVIDVVVASVLMSMGMFMLPPVMISLPFKLLLFVLVDGWSLVMGSLVKSFF